jgi:ribulose-phosphate 3-epimerase
MNPAVCPSILAQNPEQYHEQMEKVAGFAERIQIDLTDGKFAKSRTVSPNDAWWPVGVKADFHLMYDQPEAAIDTILKHKPNLIIIHAEAEGNFLTIAEELQKMKVKVGLALLPHTSVEVITPALQHLDHVLIFSGNLGEYGGRADLSLLSKVSELKIKKSELEIGWDGGINNQNIAQLAAGGVDVLNVGGYLQAAEDPHKAYLGLVRIADETGTT